MIHRSVGLKDRRVRWDADCMGRGLRTAQIMLVICYQIELDKFNIYEMDGPGEDGWSRAQAAGRRAGGGSKQSV
jgi:hypothetical protein